MSVRRQFIAGAKCPRCEALDRIRQCLDRESGREWMECVSCGYEEERPKEVTPVHEEKQESGAVTWKPSGRTLH